MFCDLKNVPEEQRAPASREILAAFISSLAGIYAGSTVANYFNSVHAWHTLHGLEWSPNSDETDALLKAAKSLAPPSSKRPPREPYTLDIITRLHAHLDLNDPLDTAVFACLTTTFFATARTGEFTVANIPAFNPAIHVTREHMSLQRDRQGLEVTNFRLPRTKSSQQGEDVSWAKQSGPCDPHAAIHHHFSLNNPPPNAHLFAYRTKKGFTPMTRTKFLKTLERAFKAAGLTPLKGHGIRIGSTLEYLLRNVPFDVVKAKGRWASDAFLVYLRKHAQIMAPYLQATPVLHESFLRHTIPPIRR
ncbi:hypothetical protein EV363DRAFT_290807 [Boletus edulis]|nr:hypothetical protein EV363DRAFT_290807 [Boletus edulis]